MRLNDLERALSTIPPHPAPRADLEQYATPADVAAPLLFEARALGDIEGKVVVDLGCGTGVLAIGASLLGASQVVGIDVDAPSLGVAREAAARLGARAELVEMDVSDWRGEADTVIMNPPFGAQKRGADRAFLEAAFRTAPVVYTMHNARTLLFVEEAAADAGYEATHRWRMAMTLKHQFRHQSKAAVDVDVVALRLERGGLRGAIEGAAEHIAGGFPASL